MSLRAKLLAITFAFMVIVVGLLTLNLSVDAVAARARERDRAARLLERLATDWIREAGGEQGLSDWGAVAQKLTRSSLVDNWMIATWSPEGLRVVSYGNPSGTPPPLDETDRKRLTEAIRERKTAATGARVYFPVETRIGEVCAVRFDVQTEGVPDEDFGKTLLGILTIMGLGTVLILLNAYVFLNRFVLRPLKGLVDASERVAAGDFSKKVAERDAYDEMGRLERAFNLMIDKIRSHQQGLEEKITKTERRLFHAQRLSATGTLAAGIAHEINNPLGGMLNAARTLQAGRLEEAKQAEYLGLIVEGLERVRALVQRVLQFRPKEFEARPVRMREVVDAAIAFCAHRLREKGGEARNEVAEDLPAVNGDAVELQQAVLNVVMNSIDACVIGEGRIEIQGRVEEENLRISISDNGRGMDGEELARCMDLFYTTKDPGEGTGLGLSVVNSILEHHGGRLEIESKRGEGTTVHLLLPVYKGVSGSKDVSGSPFPVS